MLVLDGVYRRAGSVHMRYALKTPWRDGTTHVIFEPEDFIARLAALVPRLRVIACIEQPAVIERILAPGPGGRRRRSLTPQPRAT